MAVSEAGWKDTLRAGAKLVAFALACAILCLFLVFVVPRKPPNPPATPLTSQQLAARPDLRHPAATATGVWRDTRTFGPDEPRPDRSRYHQRISTYRVVGTPASIADFYRAALAAQGWQLCSESFGSLPDVFQRSEKSCDKGSPEEIRISIDGAVNSSVQTVKIVETLPPPLEWPQP